MESSQSDTPGISQQETGHVTTPTWGVEGIRELELIEVSSATSYMATRI